MLTIKIEWNIGREVVDTLELTAESFADSHEKLTEFLWEREFPPAYMSTVLLKWAQGEWHYNRLGGFGVRQYESTVGRWIDYTLRTN